MNCAIHFNRYSTLADNTQTIFIPRNLFYNRRVGGKRNKIIMKKITG